MSKELFVVNDRYGRKVKDSSCKNKQDAKAIRKECNGVDKEGNEAFKGYTVGIGVDHWRFKV